MKKVYAVLAHATIVLSVVFMVFAVLDQYNPNMGFLTSRYTMPLLWAFCVLALACAVCLAVQSRK